MTVMTVAVLGGGVSGLAAARYLCGRVGRVVVLEGSERLGGWIDTTTHSDGVVFEHGPRTLRAAGNAGGNTLALAESLGLTDRVVSVPYSHPSAKNRMIVVGGKLHKLPNSLKTAFTKTSPFSRPLALSALTDLKAKPVLNTDESLFSFVRRRFGLEVAKYAIDPLARGVFAGNARDLSVTSLAKRLHVVEQKHGSVLKGLLKDRKNAEKPNLDLAKSELVQRARKERWSVWSLEGGLENLVRTLEQRNREDGVEIRTNTKVNGVIQSGGRLVVQTDSEELEVDHVISCLPANCLSSVISQTNLDVSRLLANIPFVTVGVVNLEYAGHLVDEPAFGYLVPSSEPNRVLGVIFDTCTFPQGNRTILTIMMGGYWFKSWFGDSPSEQTILDTAVNEVRQTLGINQEPDRFIVKILRDCIPQYVVGHSENVTNARRLLKDLRLPLSLAGNSYDGAGINDAIISAKKAAQELL
ncbi:hypothetical protein Pmani_000014 [Petrolisthes manimaculis]|uniref:Protoporphyrinogen oxidase n=1 Tax=Petrolisthes manimaculis TaxID=1843537 RepID=A0AAE1QMR5_9EUCA|nr:hypothetical protein Pmani_000014 [Petrolisthes manimaculis]